MKPIEPWYASYLLLGASAAGMVPILLPLAVSSSAGPVAVGIVMAAFSLGGLTAPLWGRLADRYRLHRLLLLGGTVGLAAATAAIAAVRCLPGLVGLAFLQGCGLAAASTVAILFIVEVRPRREWDPRIGWLQTFYATGQVAGLLAAGLLGAPRALTGLLVAGVLAGAAVLPVLLGSPSVPATPLERRPLLVHPPRHAEWPVSSPQRLYHHPGPGSLRWLRATVSPRFALFLAGWLASFAASAAFFSLYPVLMQGAYAVPPSLSSLGFAVAAAAGLFLYAPAGRWASRAGPLPLLRLGHGIRCGAFLLLWGLTFAPVALRAWTAQSAFLLVVLAWSFLGVGSTALVAELSRREGEGMGILNGVTAAGGVAGALAGGAAAGAGGFAAVPVLGVAGSALGFLVFIFWPSHRKEVVA